MNLLGNVLYDPTSAVTKGTVASAMAAFDTTNARITFVAPPSGMVRVVIQCVVHGATTFSQILLGVMEGATVKGKVVPVGSQNGTALATTMMSQQADFVVSGLTPGASLTWDAAWGIETFVASSLIKYGGPANATANNDFGALIFQIWDPCPVYTPTSATAPTSTVHVKLDTIDDFIDTEVGAIKTKTDFLPSATAGAAGGLFIAGTNAATTVTTSFTTTFTGNLTGSVGSVTGAVGSVTGAVGSVTGAVGSVTGNVGGNVTGSVGSVVGLTASNLDATVSSRSTYAGADTSGTTTLLSRLSSGRALLLDNLDATVSSRLADADYTAPDNTSVTAIKAKTDSLTFTVAGFIDANILKIAGVTVTGSGTAGSPWGP